VDLRLTDEQLALQAAARKYARERLLPLAQQTEATGNRPRARSFASMPQWAFSESTSTPATAASASATWKRCWCSRNLQSVRCARLPVFESVLVQSGPSSARQRNTASTGRAGRVSGELLVAVSMSEPQAGSALTDLATTARVHGDHVIISGTSAGAPAADTRMLCCLLPDERGCGSERNRRGYVEKGPRASPSQGRKPHGFSRRPQQRSVLRQLFGSADNVHRAAAAFAS